MSGDNGGKNNMQQTSLDAWQSIQAELNRKERMVYDVFKDRGELTIYDVIGVLGWNINCVSGRITGLRRKNVLFDTGVRRMSPSGRSCIVWGLK